MANPFGFDPTNFDPSKMDPAALMELSQLFQQLPPEKLNQLQTIMHNMMAGHDVQAEMVEFERGLPPGFREKMMAVMMKQGASPFGAPGAGGFGLNQPRSSTIDVSPSSSSNEPAPQMNEHEARMTILRAVADGSMSPEDAEKLLFS